MGLSSPSEGDHTKQEQKPFRRKADSATLRLGSSQCLNKQDPWCDGPLVLSLKRGMHMQELFPAGVGKLSKPEAGGWPGRPHRYLESLVAPPAPNQSLDHG